MGKPFGGMKSTGGGGAGAQSANAGFENFLANGINQGVFGGGNFGNAINQMLQGRVGDPNSLNAWFQNAQQGNGGVNPAALNIHGGYAPPQFQGFTPQTPGQINYAAPSWVGTDYGNPNAQNSATAQLGSAGSANVDGEFGSAVREILNRQSEKSIGDLRARYGATGSGLGSNAQFAESNFRAEALPQIAAALGNINQQERGLNLTQRGQDLQNFYAGQNNLMQGQNAQNLFNQANAGMGMQAQGMNLDALMQMNQMGQQQNQFQNQFNQGNSQFGAQFGQQADMFNANNMLQNQQMQNQFGLGQAQIGSGLQAQQSQAQQYAIAQMMQAFMQNQGLNTAQRQQVYQPGWVQQGLGAAGQIAGIAGQFANPLSGMMSGLFGGQQAPQIYNTPMNTAGAGYNQPMPLINQQIQPLPVLR
jgi:hypothetical protein